MSFRSKKDASFLTIIAGIMLIGFLGPAIPMLTGGGGDIIVPLLIFSATSGFLIWFIFSMCYTFQDDYLLVKSAFIRKQIPYESITAVRKIDSFGDMLTGFQLLSAKSGLEISYRSNVIGAVKISPQDEEAFLEELAKRCPGPVELPQ